MAWAPSPSSRRLHLLWGCLGQCGASCTPSSRSRSRRTLRSPSSPPRSPRPCSPPPSASSQRSRPTSPSTSSRPTPPSSPAASKASLTTCPPPSSGGWPSGSRPVALSTNDAFAAAGRGRGRRRGGRGRRGALSEINVTPLVDVMLVLLIVFMISAPLLTVGVPVDLPKTEAGSLQDQSEPLTVSIRADGSIYLKEDPVAFANLSPRLHEMAGPNTSKPLYVRADGKAAYAVVAQVMAA